MIPNLVLSIPPSPDNPCYKNGNCPKDFDQVSIGPPITKAIKQSKTLGVSPQISIPSSTTNGTKRIIAILIEFPDHPHTTPMDSLNSTIQKLSQYYLENSYNQLNFTNIDLTKWYMASNMMDFYGADDNSCFEYRDFGQYKGQGCNYAWRGNKDLVLEALEKADNDIDFSKYDIVLVVHAGSDQADLLGDANDLWSISWSGLGFNTNDGVTVSGAVSMSETDRLGTIVHEVAHQLGAPDLYCGSEDPAGYWDLMDKGSWSGSPLGSNPSHLSSWSKILLGWTSPTYVNPTTSYKLNILPLESNLSGIKTVKIPIYNSPNEYFLVENRQRNIGVYDSSLTETGVLVWHIDDNQFWAQPNCGSIKGVYVEDQNPTVMNPPPPQTPVDDAAYNQGDQDFTPFTNPNSNANSGASSGIYIGSWMRNGTNYLVNFDNLDTTPSLVNVYSPSNQTYNAKTVKLNISTGEIVNKIKSSLDNSNIAECSDCNSINYDITSLSDGTHTIVVNATDYANNQNIVTITFSVDTTPPAINIQSPLNKLYNSNTVLLNVSAYDMPFFTNAAWIKSSLDKGPNITECHSCSSFSHNMTSLSNGIHNVSIYAADLYDNENSANVIFNTYVPYPTITIDNPLNGSIIYSNSTTLGVSTDENSTCQYSLDTNHYSNFSTYALIDNGFCYQETANISTDCGGLNTGNYNVIGISGGFGYFYINYSLPSNVQNQGTMWQVKHGGNCSNAYNISIPYSCWLNPLQLRIISAPVPSPLLSWSQPQCYDGTSWINIGSNLTCDVGGVSSNNNPEEMYDGIWNSGYFNNGVMWDNNVNLDWEDSRNGASIDEEAIWWRSRVINNLTQIINNFSDGNHEIDVKCKNNYDAENSTKILFSVDTTPPVILNQMPTDGSYIRGTDSQLFTINYTENDLDRVELFWNETWPYTLVPPINLTGCLSGVGKSCSQNLNLTKYGENDKIVYYFGVFDKAGWSSYLMNNQGQPYTVIVHRTGPYYSSITMSPSGSPNYGQDVQLNSSWTDEAGISSVMLESNFSGILKNYTTSSQGSIYYYTIPSSYLTGNEAVSWRFVSNNTLNSWNSTDVQSFSTVKGIPGGYIAGNNSTYPNPVYIVPYESNYGDADVNYTLWRNGTLISSSLGSAPAADVSLLGAGTYSWLLNSTGGANWSSNSSIYSLTARVSPGVPPLSLSNNLSWSGTYPSSSNTTGSGCPLEIACNLYRNDTGSVSNPDIALLRIGDYNYTYNTSGGQNWTYYSTSNILTISQPLANGQSCNLNSDCSSNYCVHNVCRQSSPYCGDSFCDSGESCSSCPTDCDTCPNNNGGGGGDGGSFIGGGASPMTTKTNITNKTTAQKCQESWNCTDWSSCINNQQTRTCTDSNKCGTTISKPSESQNCIVPIQNCTENWSCSDWSACINGNQTRTCKDTNNCGTIINKPIESQTCARPGPTAFFLVLITNEWLIGIVIGVIIALVIIFAILKKKRKNN